MIRSWQAEADAAEFPAQLVIVDDHSRDSTEAVARRHAGEDSRILVLSGAELGRVRGKVSAFNLGFEHASGEFVGLIAGDDMMAPGTMRVWSEALRGSGGDDLVVAFGRLRTMSEDSKADGIVVPRRPIGNRSGGTSLFSRSLGQLVFPIPEELPSEDIWTSYLLSLKAEVVIEVPDVVLMYRIHPGNSNPRARGFADMSTAIHRRTKAYEYMLDDQRLGLGVVQRRELRSRLELESMRYSGHLWGVLGDRSTSISARVRTASMTKPSLWWLRQRLFRHLSGW